jgi:hypothetical protein
VIHSALKDDPPPVSKLAIAVNESAENYWKFFNNITEQANANDTFEFVIMPNCTKVNSTDDCVLENFNYTLGGDQPGFLDINHTGNIIFYNVSLSCNDTCVLPSGTQTSRAARPLECCGLRIRSDLDIVITDRPQATNSTNFMLGFMQIEARNGTFSLNSTS